MRRAAVAVAVMLAGSAACSLFVSVDDLQGGADAAVDTGAAQDAALDATDASSAIDASPDAPADASGPFCVTHPGHTLCADFDEDSATAGWSQSDVYVGSIDLALDASVSPPASLVSRIPDTTTNEGAGRLALELSTAIPTKIHAEMDVLLCRQGTSGYFEIFKLAYGAGYDSDGLELQINPTSAYVATDTPNEKYPLARTIAPSVWTHVAVDVVVATSGSLSVSLNGTSALALTGIDTTQSNPEAGYHAAVVGLYSTGEPACTTYFDNVLLDVQ